MLLKYKIVELCEISVIGYLVMIQVTDFQQFKGNNSLHTGPILTKCEMHLWLYIFSESFIEFYTSVI